MYVSGAKLFAASAEGGYLSEDNGSTWTEIYDEAVGDFTVVGDDIYAGTATGVMVSRNNGGSWDEAGLPGVSVYCLTSYGTDIYAGIANSYHFNAGVRKSTDFGANWDTLSSIDHSVLALKINNNKLYFLNDLGFVYYAALGTEEWNPVAFPGVEIQSIAFNGNRLYVGERGFNLNGSSNRIFYTENEGADWIEVITGMPSYFNVMALLAFDNNVFAAAERISQTDIYRSENNGLSWSVVNNGINYKQIMNFATIGNTVYAGTYSGEVYSSSNEGLSWEFSSVGIPDLPVWSLASKDDYLFAGVGENGIYISEDRGQNWVESSLTSYQFENIHIAGNVIYASSNNGVYVSEDNGENWQQRGLEYTVYGAMTSINDMLFVFVDGLGVMRTSDKGVNWDDANNGLPDSWIVSLGVSGSRLFAGTSGYGVYISDDYGANWQPANSGLPNDGYTYIYEIYSYNGVVMIGILSTLYPKASNVFYVSYDKGNNWINKSNGMVEDIVALFSIIVLDDIIYTATSHPADQGDYGRSVWQSPLSYVSVSDKEHSETPVKFELLGNYPNPFNPETTIEYSIPSGVETLHATSLRIYDILGREVAVLVNQKQPAGNYKVKFNASGLPSGMYLYKIQAGNFSAVKKLMLVK